MLNEGLTLMATGMATVFSFLVILWFAVSIMGKIVLKLNEIFPEQIQQVKAAVKTISDDTAIAISLAAAKLKR